MEQRCVTLQAQSMSYTAGSRDVVRRGGAVEVVVSRLYGVGRMAAVKNTAKYLSYKEAWMRIKSASSAGYYFEVVALSESIISDRILSYLHWKNPATKSGVKTAFANLIGEWRKLAGTSLPAYGSTDLGAAVDTWRDERNLVVHGLTKSMPGVPTDPVGPFIVRAKKAAQDGADLARAVSTWYTKQKKPPKKTSPTAAAKSARKAKATPLRKAKKDAPKKRVVSTESKPKKSRRGG